MLDDFNEILNYSKRIILFNRAIPQGFSSTHAIANAGLRVRWNIGNLYIHLCWLTVEQQFNPALAIG